MLGLFWAPALGAGQFFTADNSAQLRLWAVPGQGAERICFQALRQGVAGALCRGLSINSLQKVLVRSALI